MNTECQTIIFSEKAYNAVITETFKKDPYETGGILLGHILDNGIWIVMEVLPPGWRSVFEYAYFEYDQEFVNYVAENESKKYDIELQLLGLWHRHPGSMDTFSGTDDVTNRTFAGLQPKGAISGIVNIDPRFRLTMYHVSNPLSYQKTEFEVGDDLIPDEYFKLKYFNEDRSLNPIPKEKKNDSRNSGKISDYASGKTNPIQTNDPLFLKNLNSKHLFLLLFFLSLFFAIFSSYAYLKFKDRNELKLLHNLYFKNSDGLSTQGINGVLGKTKLPENLNAIEKSSTDNLESTTDGNSETNTISKEKTNTTNTAASQSLERESEDKTSEQSASKTVNEKKKKEKDVNVYSDNNTVEEELDKNELPENKNVKETKANEVKTTSANTIPNPPDTGENSVQRDIFTLLIMLVVSSILSLILVFFPKKLNKKEERLIIGSAAIVSFLLSMNHFFSLAFMIKMLFLFVLFEILCLLIFMTFKKFVTKNNTESEQQLKKEEKKKTNIAITPTIDGYWFQKNPNLYIKEENDIKQRFPKQEKTVENGIVSFLIHDYQATSLSGLFNIQLVFSADYPSNKEIKIYLIEPDLDKLKINKSEHASIIAIDGSGESYLNFSALMPKDQISGVSVINKFDEWLNKNI
jgi:hypothetical protein